MHPPLRIELVRVHLDGSSYTLHAPPAQVAV
jgi:hypothetical protein